MARNINNWGHFMLRWNQKSTNVLHGCQFVICVHYLVTYVTITVALLEYTSNKVKTKKIESLMIKIFGCFLTARIYFKEVLYVVWFLLMFWTIMKNVTNFYVLDKIYIVGWFVFKDSFWIFSFITSIFFLLCYLWNNESQGV